MNHYDKLAARYDEYYRYSDEYISYFTNKIIANLPVRTGEVVVELGAGTCIFAKEISKKFPSAQMVCVDNNELMLHGTNDKHIRQVCQDAVAFSNEGIVYDKIYMKEFIHHLAKDARISLFNGVYRQLKEDGALLILMEPRQLKYPLFHEALNRFQDNQPSRLTIMDELELAGFTTSYSVLSYPIYLSKGKFLEMVRNRYMSVLETFTDDELEDGIREINRNLQDENLVFPEIFYCIKGTK